MEPRMAALKKGPPKVGDEAGPTKQPARKPIPLGTDPALALPTSKGKALSLTFWDVWFALVAVRAFGRDFRRLADGLKQRETSSLDRGAVEGKRSHLRDLEGRLAATGLAAWDVVAAAGDLARGEVRRARSRVLGHSERQYERSEPMRNTPRERRFEHATRRRGVGTGRPCVGIRGLRPGRRPARRPQDDRPARLAPGPD